MKEKRKNEKLVKKRYEVLPTHTSSKTDTKPFAPDSKSTPLSNSRHTVITEQYTTGLGMSLSKTTIINMLVIKSADNFH